MNDEDFVLGSNSPKPKLVRVVNGPQPKQRQGKLFSGLHLLPGQADLFPTDGRESDENDHETAERR